MDRAEQTTARDASTLPATSDLDALTRGIEGARTVRAFADAALSLQLALLYDRALEATEGLPAASREMELRSASAEAAIVLRRAPRGALGEMERAHAVLIRFPATQKAWSEGHLDAAHVRAIERHGSPIERLERREIYERILLDEAPGLTPRELDARAKRLAAEARELGFEDRHAEAARDRRVFLRPGEDGMSELTAIIPAWQATAVMDRLGEHAKALRNADAENSKLDPDAPRDERSFDSIRADTFVDLLLGGDAQQIAQAHPDSTPRIHAKIALEVPVMALLGETSEPAELHGHGPVPLAAARQLAAEQPAYERLLTHPITRLPIASEAYRPSAALERILAARDRTCRFPGCTRPAHRCDLDHTTAWADGGATSADNLAHLCRAHHTLKHAAPAWKVQQTGGGALEWTSPAGITRTTHPARRGPELRPGSGSSAAPDRPPSGARPDAEPDEDPPF